MVHYFIMKQSWGNAKCSLGGGGGTCRAGDEGGTPPDTFAFAFALDNLLIYITRFNFERLEELLAVAAAFNYRDRGDLEKLEEELQKGKVVDSKEIPPNVITMNSRVRLLDIDKNQTMV